MKNIFQKIDNELNKVVLTVSYGIIGLCGFAIGLFVVICVLSNFPSIIYWFFTNAAGYAVLAAIGLGLFLGWLRDKKPSEPDKQPDNKYDSFFETYTETTTWRR